MHVTANRTAPRYQSAIGEMVWVTFLFGLATWGVASLQLIDARYINLLKSLVALGDPKTVIPFIFLMIAAAPFRLLSGSSPQTPFGQFVMWAAATTSRLGSGGLMIFGALILGLLAGGLMSGETFPPPVFFAAGIFWLYCAGLSAGTEWLIAKLSRDSPPLRVIWALVAVSLLPMIPVVGLVDITVPPSRCHYSALHPLRNRTRGAGP